MSALDASFEVAGGAMHIRCMGVGSPVVIFDSAIEHDSTEWNDVAPAVARTTRVCVYDRKGVGSSDPPTLLPHTNRQMADELHTLLAQAAVTAPWILVGHSVGGINVRLFASTYPEAVAGMVLVEAADDPTPLWSLMPPDAVAKRREELRRGAEGLDYDAFVSGAEEMHRTKRPLGDRPLIVLSRGLPDAPPSASAAISAAWLRVWDQQQAALPSLSTNAARVVAKNSGHFMPTQVPALVVAAVDEVVSAVRAQRRVDTSALVTLADAPARPTR